MWIWACWSYLAQEFSWCSVGFTTCLGVSGLLATYLSSECIFPRQVERRFHSWELNCQPLHSESYPSTIIRKFRVISDFSKFTMKHQQKLNFPLFSYGYWKCKLVDSLIKYIGTPNDVHYWVWSVLWVFLRMWSSSNHTPIKYRCSIKKSATDNTRLPYTTRVCKNRLSYVSLLSTISSSQHLR